MKISEYKQMMAYLTRPKTKGGEVKVRKPNAVPPKTKTIQKFSKGGAAEKPYGKVLFNQGTGKFEGLTPEDDLLFEGIEYDAVLGKFVDSKTGKTGSLSDFTEVMKKKGTFEQIVDRLKAKVKDGRVTDTTYNDGRIERTKNGKVIRVFGEDRLTGDLLISQWERFAPNTDLGL